MISEMLGALNKLRSYLLLEHRIPTYRQRAEYCEQRAILESMKGGVLIDREKGVDLIDVIHTTAITLPTGRQVEFARDGNGIYFARIEGSKYYPINTELAENLLRESREYEMLSRSFWRRVLREPYERTLGTAMFQLKDSLYGCSDSLFQLHLTIEDFTRGLEVIAEKVETTNRRVAEEVRKLKIRDTEA